VQRDPLNICDSAKSWKINEWMSEIREEDKDAAFDEPRRWNPAFLDDPVML
jgi:hypothetical protein